MQRKEKVLKKQHREALLLDNMMGVNGLAPGHSLRGRKRVSYTFGKALFGGLLILFKFHHKFLVFLVIMWVMDDAFANQNITVSMITYYNSEYYCIFQYSCLLDCTLSS